MHLNRIWKSVLKFKKYFFWIFCILIPISIVLLQQIPLIKYQHDNLNLWHNVFLTFFISDVTIISIFFGILIPILIGASKTKMPLAFLGVIKNKVFNKKMLFLISLTLVIHSLQLITCILKKDNEIINVILVIFTTIYFLIFFYYISFTTKTFNYSSYFYKQILIVFKMINKDVLKKTLTKRRKNKYNRVIGFVFDGFPTIEDHFKELEALRIDLGVGLYYLAINLFSNGLFLFERFNFFKKISPIINLKYVKDNDLSFSYELNFSRELMIKKLTDFFDFFKKDDLVNLFNKIRIGKNIILFGKLSSDGMSFLTTLHLKLSNLKIWEIDLTWILFLSEFIQTSASLVKIKSKKELWIDNKASAKKFVKANIFINPGLFEFFNKICNDKKVLKRSFNNDAWKKIHSYTAMQSLFGIGKFAMDNKEDIKKMLSLEIYKSNKFLFNRNIESLVEDLTNLSEYVNSNKAMKSENKLFWNEQLKIWILKSKLKIEIKDVENIQIIKYNEISDFLLSIAPYKILKSDKLLKDDALPILTDKIYEYIIKNIQKEIDELQLFNVSKYHMLKLVPYSLINIITQLLRVQLVIYNMNSEYFKNAEKIILQFIKIRQNFFLTSERNNTLEVLVNEKFKLTKKTHKNVFGFYNVWTWFNLSFLRDESLIRKEKEEWENQKK